MCVFRCLKAECLKCRHSALYYIHLVVPIIGALIFAAYYQGVSWSATEKVTAYLEILAVAFPFLIGIIVGLVIQTEAQAGGFQVMLGMIPSRVASYIGKICFLVICALVAVILALGVFAGIYREAPLDIYCKAGVLLLFTALPIYLLHMLVGMHYGKGASMGLGIVGSLVAALMITGMGDAIWNYVPWAWGVRAMDYIVLAWDKPDLYAQIQWDFMRGMWITFVVICCLLAISLLWFGRWEGQKGND